MSCVAKNGSGKLRRIAASTHRIHRFAEKTALAPQDLFELLVAATVTWLSRAAQAAP